MTNEQLNLVVGMLRSRVDIALELAEKELEGVALPRKVLPVKAGIDPIHDGVETSPVALRGFYQLLKELKTHEHLLS